MPKKILDGKSYGSICHIQGSRMGPGDRKINDGMQRIATEKARDKYDHVIVEEKLDGSNVGVVKLEGTIYPVGRAGYLASTSPYQQHQLFAEWVDFHQKRFLELLGEGERVCGEWLIQAHATRYELPHEPFVAFDIIREGKRLSSQEVSDRIPRFDFITPKLIHSGSPFSVDDALKAIAVSGHGALDSVEGAVWRVERYLPVEKKKGSDRRWVVDFLTKYVRPDKKDGIFLPGIGTNEHPIWNTFVGDKWLADKIEEIRLSVPV
jgi:hypothetical protein